MIKRVIYLVVIFLKRSKWGQFFIIDKRDKEML
jgi:hypothetical protein